MTLRVRLLAAVLLLTGCAAPARSAPQTSGTADQASTVMSMVMPTSATPTSTSPAPKLQPSRLVDPATFAAAVASTGTVTIDVHVPFQGRIAGTDLEIPYTDIAARAAELPADHGTELAIYCRSGNMSAIAATTLAALGYTDVVELRGGMDSWEAAGRTLLMTP